MMRTPAPPLAPAALAAGLFCLGLALCGPADAKIPVQSLDDLPRHSYPVTLSVTELLDSPAQFAEFCGRVRADLEADLEAYDIQDRATLQRLYGTLSTIALLEERYDDALLLMEKTRELEDKEAQRLLSGLRGRAMIAARRATGAWLGDERFHAELRRLLRESLAGLPWAVIQEEIEQTKGRMEIFSESFVRGMIQGQLDPVVLRSGEISGDTAPQVINLGYLLQVALQTKDDIIAVYGDLIAANRTEKADIWAARELELAPDAGLAPVVMAVWDSGVDVSVYEGRLFVNPAETVDGRDDDGNGFVDDVHGIAFDHRGAVSPDLLHPLGDQADELADAMTYTKGLNDLIASVESDEAAELRRHLATLPQDEVTPFMESISFAALHMHGTHVAGIMERGNPFARLLVARISFDYHTVPEPVTEEVARALADSYRRTGAYFREHGVRVVNMSWGWSLKEIENGLEINNLGASAEERGELARRALDILKQGLLDVMNDSPGILFVAAAGNDDNDIEFDEFIPGSIALPNLLMVGAVDQAGERTGFTSGGQSVRIYANGYEVESYVPGGRREKESGTSMASPNVANLAGKLLALRPGLSPTGLIALIEESADPVPGEEGMLIINPRRAAELLEEGKRGT
jgi:subtilisin family serine protease